jgi:hypothetical protein
MGYQIIMINSIKSTFRTQCMERFLFISSSILTKILCMFWGHSQCHQDKFQKINKCYFPYTTRSLCWWIKTNRF